MVIELDIPTLSAALGVVYLSTLTFSILLFVSRQVFAGARLWMAAQLLLSIGALNLVFRELSNWYVIVCIANTAVLSSGIFMAHSIWRFKGDDPFPVWLYAFVPVIFIIWFLMQDQSISLRTTVFSLISGPSALALAILIVRDSPKEYLRSNIVTGIPFMLVGIGHFARLPENIFGPAVWDFGLQGPVNSITYLLSIFTAFYTLFGYYMMSSVRHEMEIRKRGDAIAAKNEDLEKLAATKDTLYSVIAHDLRGPISSAARYVGKYLMPENIDLNKKRDAIGALSVTLNATSNLLENLLSWTRSQSGELIVKPEVIALDDMLYEAAETVTRDAQAKNIKLSVTGKRVQIKADKPTLAAVFRNILSNAVKFTPHGGTVTAAVETEAGRVLVSISDSGVGMNEEQIDRLFDPLRKIVTIGTNGERGSGLGLLLCRDFVHKNGGDIQVISSKEQGSTFLLGFPLPPEPGTEKAP